MVRSNISLSGVGVKYHINLANSGRKFDKKTSKHGDSSNKDVNEGIKLCMLIRESKCQRSGLQLVVGTSGLQ